MKATGVVSRTIEKFSRNSIQAAEETFTRVTFKREAYPLHDKIRNPNFAEFQDKLANLIKNAKDLNSQDWNKNTPLHAAAESGNVLAVKLLIQQGARINENFYGETPLQVAEKKYQEVQVHERNKYKEIVDFLKKQPSEILSNKSIDEEKKIIELRKLIQQGFGVDSVDESGNTLLHIAVEKNLLEVVKYLVDEAKAKVNLENTSSDTPLKIAAKKKNKEIEEYLRTGFHRAIFYKQDFLAFQELLEQLIEQGFNINDQDKYKNTPLHHAVIESDIDSVRWLTVYFDIDLTLKNNYGQTPLEIAELFATTSPDRKEIADFLRSPPLHRAILVNAGREWLLTVINSFGTDLKARGSEGNTAWHIAVKQAHLAALELLLERCPEIANATNDSGLTPADLVEFYCSGLLEEEKKKILQFFIHNESIQPSWASGSRDLSKMLKSEKRISEGLKQIEMIEINNATQNENLEKIKEQIKEEKKASQKEPEKLLQLEKRKEELTYVIKDNKTTIQALKKQYKYVRFDPAFFARNCLKRLSFPAIYEAVSFFVTPPSSPPVIIPPPPATFCEWIRQIIKNFFFGEKTIQIVEPVKQSRDPTLLISMASWAIVSSLVNTLMRSQTKMGQYQSGILSFALTGAIVMPITYSLGNVDLQQMGLLAIGTYGTELVIQGAIPTLKFALRQFNNLGSWFYQKTFGQQIEPQLIIKRNSVPVAVLRKNSVLSTKKAEINGVLPSNHGETRRIKSASFKRYVSLTGGKSLEAVIGEGKQEKKEKKLVSQDSKSTLSRRHVDSSAKTSKSNK